METQKDYSCLENNNIVYSKNIDIENDYQEALPAYCDDVYRIVKCTSRSYITSADINFNEVKIFGKCEICITYFNENSNLCYADFEEEFNKTLAIENLSEAAFVCAQIVEKYTNYRVINQRRIDIHTSNTIQLNIYDTIKCPSIVSCNSSKMKKENIKISNVINSDVSRIEFDEEFSVPADSAPIKRIISYSASAAVSEVKIIKDKALIKCIVSLAVLYTTDENEERILKSEYSFNVSKIIESSGVDDTDIAVSNVTVGNIYLKAKAPTGNDMNVIDAFGELSVTTLFIRESNQDIITDGYILNHNSQCSYSDYNCMTDATRIEETKQINLTYDLSAEITVIKESEINLSPVVIRNGNAVFNVVFKAICETATDNLITVSSSQEVQIPVGNFDAGICSVNNNGYDFTLGNGGRVDVRLTLGIDFYLYNNRTVKVLSDIESDDVKVNYPSLSVYFGKESESVWNIAKTFSSDIDLIKKENELNSDILDSNKVLIIPRV